MKKNSECKFCGGFISIIVLILSVLIISIWFAKIYSTPKPTDGKTQIETYNDAIKEAENVKRAIEGRNVDGGF